MNKKTSISLLTLSLCLSLNGADLIIGTADAPAGETFSFNVNKNIISRNGNFYEGALTNITDPADQPFALSRLMRGAQAFMPLAPELVTLANVPESVNPIFGAGIVALGLLEVEDGFSTRDIPVVVTENNPNIVCLLENAINTKKISMVVSNPIHDAAGNISSGIVDLTTNIVNHIFAAAQPNGGQFGDLNSGIALLVRGTLDGSRVFGEVNATTGSIVNPQALLLDPTSPVLNIQSSILGNIVPNVVSLHWDNSLQALYIGLQVTANSAAGDGARAVAVCTFTGTGGIQLLDIAPDSAFTNGNTSTIIGVIGADQQVSINALKTLYTSTALNYLIVAGGNGSPASTQQTVYALPLVNSGTAKGTIAQKTAVPQDLFQDAPVPRFTGRALSQPALTTSDMPQSTDIAAQVGGGPLGAGPIVNLITRDDTVFAFVGDNTGTNNPGVYSSQAIFNTAGTITSWTAWQRAAGTTEQIFGCALDAGAGNFILASGTTSDTVNTIQRTVWSSGSPTGLQPLTTILDSTFSSTNGGIQGLQTFLPNTPESTTFQY